MQYVYADITQQENFFGNSNPVDLLKKYGSPLYVYNEKIYRSRCREMKNLLTYDNFSINYSVKANCNLALLKIALEEGLNADAMSPGEIFFELEAGFKPEQILFIPNNVSAEEMAYAVERNITVSVDSISQLAMFGKLNPGGSVAIRFNPGIGAGHHDKVVTGGDKTKFGVEPRFIDEIKTILQRHKLNLVGINQHIGSLFMDASKYVESVKLILAIAEQFDDLQFVDFGGGMGIPYRKQENQSRLDIKELGTKLDEVLTEWINKTGRKIRFKMEPGRYIAAECGVLLGTVHAVKMNYNRKYIGTDLGFNVLVRPVMYESHHDIEVYRESAQTSDKKEEVVVVGNICESGDILAEQRLLPEIFENDVIGILDAGAYGSTMSSNYNNRMRPAEVLITEDGQDILVRKRDTIEDMLKPYLI